MQSIYYLSSRFFFFSFTPILELDVLPKIVSLLKKIFLDKLAKFCRRVFEESFFCPKNGQTYFKHFAANAAKFLMSVWPSFGNKALLGLKLHYIFRLRICTGQSSVSFANISKMLGSLLENYNKNALPVRDGKPFEVSYQVFIEDMIPLEPSNMVRKNLLKGFKLTLKFKFVS